MDSSKPIVTSTAHVLPFERLSPLHFERLCLWLVEREGYVRARHLGLGGSEQGRDVVAYKITSEGEELWYFQCKRYRSIKAATLKKEVDKYVALAEERAKEEIEKRPHAWPTGIVFVISSAVTARVEEDVADYCIDRGLAYEFWAQTELDMRVKRHRDIIAEFFQPLSRDRADELHDYIRNAVSRFETGMYGLVARSSAVLREPYKFLYAFDIEDAGIFFGRDTAAEALHKTVLQNRLTILHARSGAGKTSLLNAGLSPRLIREGYLPVYARAYDDPVRAIKQAIAPPSLEPWPDLLPQLTLHEFLGRACASPSRKTRGLVLILDQFEDFFIFQPEQADRQSFIDTLAACHDDGALPVHFVISLRKDYYSDLADLQQRIPTIFYKQHRLDVLTHGEAKKAITGPVAKLDQSMTYEPALLEELLGDLMAGGMELPYLQIVCTRLYEELPRGETVITLNAYENMGRTEGVLGRYLQDVLDQLSGKGADIAKAVLVELVSSQATRRVLSRDALASSVEAEKTELESVLYRLVDARLLRRDEIGGEVVYEMAHEYLVEEVSEWINREDMEFKQAEELLAREIANWQVHGTLIPRERLELLYAHRERFTGLDDELWQWILQSAVKADFHIEEWGILAGLADEKLALISLGSPSEQTRRAAMQRLGQIWSLKELSRLGHPRARKRARAAEALGERNDARAVEPLIAALGDEKGPVRRQAASALGEIGDVHAVEPLVAALEDEDSNVRWEAASALGEIGGVRAVESLIAALKHQDMLVRWEAAIALSQIGDARAVEPLIAALGDERQVREKAVEGLVQLGQRVVEQLIVALGDENSGVCSGAAKSLGEIGDARAVEPLIVALGDQDSDVRWMAARSLGQLGDVRVVEPLIAALGDENWTVRASATTALGTFGDARVVEPIIAALRDEHREVRKSAIRALEKLGDARAVEPLIAALEDEYKWVRAHAGRALGTLGDARAVESLIAALGDKDEYVGPWAAEALKRIGTPEARAALEKAGS